MLQATEYISVFFWITPINLDSLKPHNFYLKKKNLLKIFSFENRNTYI